MREKLVLRGGGFHTAPNPNRLQPSGKHAQPINTQKEPHGRRPRQPLPPSYQHCGRHPACLSSLVGRSRQDDPVRGRRSRSPGHPPVVCTLDLPIGWDQTSRPPHPYSRAGLELSHTSHTNNARIGAVSVARFTRRESARGHPRVPAPPSKRTTQETLLARHVASTRCRPRLLGRFRLGVPATTPATPRRGLAPALMKGQVCTPQLRHRLVEAPEGA